MNVGLALVVDRAAQRHDDPRLLLVGLGFLAAALFFVLHALATPGVLLDSRNGGFALATPVGLALGALFTAVSALEFPPERAQRVLRVGPWLRSGVYTLAAVWGIFSLAGLPPLRDPAIAARLSGPLTAVAVVSVLLYVFVAVRFYLLYRRRRSVMLLSIITANILLAEAMVAVVLSVNWRLSWWLWHVLMVLAFGYVAYSAYVGYRREGATTGLFDGVRTDETVRAVRAEYEAALETLVGALRRQEAGEISADEMEPDHRGDGDPVRADRGADGGARPGGGRPARRARADRPAGHARGDRARVAGAAGGAGPAAARRAPGRRRLRRRRRPRRPARRRAPAVPRRARDRPELAGRRRHDAPRGGERRRTAAGWSRSTLDEAILACPLTVKDKPAGVLLTRRQSGFSERDRSLFASLASQLSMGMENARLYHQLDGLFRAYMSPDVATALLADPEQAALGGAVVEVTALFADLRGFTGFSERSTPEEIVVMLNQLLRARHRRDPGTRAAPWCSSSATP